MLGYADYCLSGNTQVEIKSPDGVITTMFLKDIVDQQLPGLVRTWTGTDVEWVPITQYHNRGPQECFTYKLSNGSSITCTPDHEFLHEGVFKPIGEINV